MSELQYLRRAMSLARREALEEAAKACERVGAESWAAMSRFEVEVHPFAETYAAAIRALIDQKPPEEAT